MKLRTPHGPAARRRVGVLTGTVTASALLLTACGIVGDGDGSAASAAKKDDDITVGLLLPGHKPARFDEFDQPLITKQVAALTHGKGKVVARNAESDADKQEKQFAELIDKKVDVVLVDPIDSRAIAAQVQQAKDAGIPVIAYDRLAEGPIDAYISHDNELVGQLQGQALLKALGDKAATSKVVLINGSSTDPNTVHLKKGLREELKGNVVMAGSYDTRDWRPELAQKNMEKAIAAVGLDNIDAVYSANDGMAGAVIETLKKAGVTQLPPVTGQDAELAAVQRIISGEQYMSVYKPFQREAESAAEMAVAKVQGRSIEFDALTRDSVDSPTRKGIPAMLVPVVALTKDNIKQTVIQDDVYTVEDICTPKYKAKCDAIGLTS
ncbi:sugar ABC transporter substrate-binding protein [Streptomyces sp. B3I8]|uniref:sugar ABC transporter substrate-binding protein n=1 Tax=Streptomyces sp. B3I8 TaxID=3042303 RepID=UPI00278A8772|nr:substrate-binding domain-containing protein [Streptomyces sp. B3I8]MDQ0788178.1 D-xylose transport system substrate-binding protein [Streptomyces sp. B3I8]